jgi:TonB family protein
LGGHYLHWQRNPFRWQANKIRRRLIPSGSFSFALTRNGYIAIHPIPFLNSEMTRFVFLFLLISGLITTVRAQQDTVATDSLSSNGLASLELLPEYRFGLEGLKQYFDKHLVYPKEAKKKNIQGTVYVSFIVDSSGVLHDFIVREGVGYGCDEEAVRLLKGTSPWIPARKEGRPVAMRYVMPVQFSRKK